MEDYGLTFHYLMSQQVVHRIIHSILSILFRKLISFYVRTFEKIMNVDMYTHMYVQPHLLFNLPKQS